MLRHAAKEHVPVDVVKLGLADSLNELVYDLKEYTEQTVC